MMMRVCPISFMVANCPCPAMHKGWWNEDTQEVSLETLFYNMYVRVTGSQQSVEDKHDDKPEHHDKPEHDDDKSEHDDKLISVRMMICVTDTSMCVAARARCSLQRK